MYIIYRGRNYDVESTYNENSIVGLYENYDDAHNDLINKLNQLKYGYEIQGQAENYLYICCYTKNNKNIVKSYVPFFEIKNKPLNLNQIRFR